ncbi:hypothetical protein COOONC_17543 [Cooperia oncophora]
MKETKTPGKGGISWTRLVTGGTESKGLSAATNAFNAVYLDSRIAGSKHPDGVHGRCGNIFIWNAH